MLGDESVETRYRSNHFHRKRNIKPTPRELRRVKFSITTDPELGGRETRSNPVSVDPSVPVPDNLLSIGFISETGLR